MNILFLTMSNFESIYEHSLYPDLIRCFSNMENRITVLLPQEKKKGKPTELIQEGNIKVIKVCTGNLFDVGLKTKLLSRAMLCHQYEDALSSFCKEEQYDLVLSTTPPTIMYPLINKIKKRDGAYSYLMLKDIFPQNAVDLGMIRKNGIIHRFLRIFERNLYKSADTIGCMSPANIKYLLKQDPWIRRENVTLCPNAIEISSKKTIEKEAIRNKYGIPVDKTVFIYGGGIGKPQGIGFFEQCIKCINNSVNYIFVVVGTGPYIEELRRLSQIYKELLIVIPWLPIDDFADVVAASDVGLILLDHRFTIPNFPSRLLAYLNASLPVAAATDSNCDVGIIAEINGFGHWCISEKTEDFIRLIEQFENENDRREMGENARRFLEKNYDVKLVAESIIDRVKERIPE